MICFLENLASRNIHTRSHPYLDPPKATNDPKKMIIQKKFEEGQASNSPIHRSHTLPESIVTVEDIDFDLPFEHSLFRSKSETFFFETIID